MTTLINPVSSNSLFSQAPTQEWLDTQAALNRVKFQNNGESVGYDARPGFRFSFDGETCIICAVFPQGFTFWVAANQAMYYMSFETAVKTSATYF